MCPIKQHNSLPIRSNQNDFDHFDYSAIRSFTECCLPTDYSYSKENSLPENPKNLRKANEWSGFLNKSV